LGDITFNYLCYGAIGTVVLDKLSVDKILSRFKFSLVKFDTFYPTGIENSRDRREIIL